MRALAGSVAAVLVCGLAAISPGSPAANASTGGGLRTVPVEATLSPALADGSVSGQLDAIDLPVYFGDQGTYLVPGLDAPVGDATGNGEVVANVPAGDIDGTIYDAEDGELVTEQGRGLTLTGGSDRVARTPAGLTSETTVTGLQVSLNDLNDKVATVLGRDVIATVGSVTTTADNGVNGEPSATSTVSDLTLLGTGIALDEGRLAEPASRSVEVEHDDPEALMRALGVDEEDIDQFAGLISSATLRATLTVSASMPETGGLTLAAHLELHAEAEAILNLGAADLSASDEVLLVHVAAVQNGDAPEPMTPQVTAGADVADAGEDVSMAGVGFVPGATTVSLGGTVVPVIDVAADGTTLTFTVPGDTPGGSYTIVVSTPGGDVDAGSMRVVGEDTVPLRVDAVTPPATHDGTIVEVTGAGLSGEHLAVTFVDAEGVRYPIASSQITTTESGLTMQVRLPESVALGEGLLVVELPGESAEVALTIEPLVLEPIPATGSASVLGLQGQSHTVPLTEDNSSIVTWDEPDLINPAGSSASQTLLTVHAPDPDSTGAGLAEVTEAGMTGSIERTLTSLNATANASNYQLELPAPWGDFFGITTLVTATSLTATATATTDGATGTDVQIEGLQVLGETVPLAGGQVDGERTFTLRRDHQYLRDNRSMDGVFFASANEAYDELQDVTYALLTVTVTPGESTQARTAAFHIDADITYRYEGENGGFLSTRARHGTGNDRNGQRVDLYEATVAQVEVTAPDPVRPDVVTANPTLVESGDEVTLTGRALTGDTVVLIGEDEVSPDTIATDGTELTFTVPERTTAETQIVVRVRTGAGQSETTRTLTWKSAPSFQQHPQGVTVRLEESAAFSVEVTGTPTPELQWQHLSDGGWADIPGENGTSLTVLGTAQTHGAQYRAVADNGVGVASSEAATLTVESEPVIVTGPQPVEADSGQSALFAIEVTAVPAAVVTWQIDRGDGFVTIDEATGHELNLLAEPADNGAHVRAVVSNAVGTVISEAAQLTVRYGPIITAQPADAVVQEGEDATFAVVADSNPAADVRWEFRHPLGGDWQQFDTEAHPSALSSTLTLPTLLSYDGLRMRAVLSTPGFTPVPSEAATLTVQREQSEPGASGVSALASPLSIGASALVGHGEAAGGSMSSLLNGYLTGGVEITEPGLFSLPELGTPDGAGTVTAEHPAGVPAGEGVGDIPAGAAYGDVQVSTTWDAEGIRTSTTVDHLTLDHRALDEDGRIGQVLGIDEIVYADGVESLAVALLDNDAPTHVRAQMDTLRVLGQPVTEVDGLVGGELTEPVTRTVEATVEDPAGLAASLGLDLSEYLQNEVLGGATATVEVTASQPHETTPDTALAVGLHVQMQISLDVQMQTQGGDTALFETVNLSTEGLQDAAEVIIAASTAARNGASLPEPDDGTGGENPGEGEEYPAEDPADPVDIDTYTPTRAPARVVATPTADPATGRSITWRTADDVTSGVLQYRSEPGAAALEAQGLVTVNAVTSQPVTRTASDSSGTQEWTVRSHRVTMTDLTPATQYEYRVGDGQDDWSPWYTFTTASADADPFTFLYVADAQNDLRAYWAEAARQAYDEVPEAEVVLHAGDLINNVDNDVEWAEWFDADPDTNASRMHVPAVGNHEYEDGLLGEIWRDSFTLPGNGPQPDLSADACTVAYEKHIAAHLDGTTYYTDYQGVRFVTLNGNWSLNSSVPSSEALAAEGCTAPTLNPLEKWLDMQSQWLDEVLADNPGQWSVVALHQPIYSVSVSRDNGFLRETFGPVIEEHNVDLVLQGHDHSYGRGHLYANEVDGHEELSTGPVYAVSVLGPKDYVVDDGDNNDWESNGANRVAVYGQTRTYQEITVDGGQLTYTAHAYPSGEVVDAFEICKSADGEKFVANDGADLPPGCSMALPEVENERAPSISGSPVVGRTLDADPGVWEAGASLTYQWLSDGVAIPGATQATYELTQAEAGTRITLRVDATLAAHAPTAFTSEPTAPVVDLGVLSERIAEADAIERAGYTEDSLTALDTALAAARGVLNVEAPTLEDVAAALEALDAALAGLIEQDPGDGGTGGSDGGDTDAGDDGADDEVDGSVDEGSDSDGSAGGGSSSDGLPGGGSDGAGSDADSEGGGADDRDDTPSGADQLSNTGAEPLLALLSAVLLIVFGAAVLRRRAVHHRRN